MSRGLLAVAAALVLAPGAGAAEGRVIFTDPLTGVPGQHATAVEPDTSAWGNTVVAAFQVGRVADGGAAAIGWATSGDGGGTWRTGLLPGLTASTTPAAGPFARVSDPAVAFDRVHGVWLVSVLTVDALPGGDRDSSIVVSRSADGVTWSLPVITSPSRGVFAHDKNWIACDNWPSSPHAGRCYTTWSNPRTGSTLTLATSADGGLGWGPGITAPDGSAGSGTQPVVRPDGTLVIPHLVGRTAVRAVSSPDGGATLGMSVAVAAIEVAPVPELRAPPLPSAEVNAGGRVYVAWHDCRFRRSCGANDIVLASSPDGRTWTAPVRVPLSRLRVGGPIDRSETHHVIPGLAVDPGSGGARTRLALASYAVDRFCAAPLNCPIAATYVSSPDGGLTWSDPVALSDPQPLTAIAETTQGRMVGDYVSTSFVANGVAVPVVSAPIAGGGGAFAQPILAARFAPRRAAPVRVASLAYGRAPTRPGARLTARIELDRRPVRGVAVCTARVGKRAIKPLRRTLGAEHVDCAWRIPRRSGAAEVRATIGLRHAAGAVRRTFDVPIRRR